MDVTSKFSALNLQSFHIVMNLRSFHTTMNLQFSLTIVIFNLSILSLKLTQKCLSFPTCKLCYWTVLCVTLSKTFANCLIVRINLYMFGSIILNWFICYIDHYFIDIELVTLRSSINIFSIKVWKSIQSLDCSSLIVCYCNSFIGWCNNIKCRILSISFFFPIVTPLWLSFCLTSKNAFTDWG